MGTVVSLIAHAAVICCYIFLLLSKIIFSLNTVEEMSKRGIHPQTGGVCFAQLLGMSDHLTYTLGLNGYKAYKYVPYGPVNEVMPYLIRRAHENRWIWSVVLDVTNTFIIIGFLVLHACYMFIFSKFSQSSPAAVCRDLFDFHFHCCYVFSFMCRSDFSFINDIFGKLEVIILIRILVLFKFQLLARRCRSRTQDDC